MIGEAARGESRNQEILRNAIEAFGSYGVRGASLREIARRAGVSLTLIHHHFGNKPSLVWATTHSILKAGAAALSKLKRDLSTADSPPVLVAAWTRYLDEAFGSSSRAPHLRLIHRLRGDPDVDATTQASLDAAEPFIREALCRLYPAAGEASVDVVLHSSRAALLTVMLDDGSPTRWRAKHPRLDAHARQLVEKFVAVAISASLDGAAENEAGDGIADVDQLAMG